MTLLDSLPHTCSIYRQSYTQGETGGDQATATAKAEDVACWYQPATSGEIFAYARRDQRITGKVYFSTEQSIFIGDTIVMDDGPVAGHTLTVVAFADDSAGLEVLWAAFVNREEDSVIEE